MCFVETRKCTEKCTEKCIEFVETRYAMELLRADLPVRRIPRVTVRALTKLAFFHFSTPLGSCLRLRGWLRLARLGRFCRLSRLGRGRQFPQVGMQHILHSDAIQVHLPSLPLHIIGQKRPLLAVELGKCFQTHQINSIARHKIHFFLPLPIFPISSCAFWLRLCPGLPREGLCALLLCMWQSSWHAEDQTILNETGQASAHGKSFQ